MGKVGWGVSWWPSDLVAKMVHKNLRTLLYYVVGVTAVCLMIEVTVRVSLQVSKYDVNLLWIWLLYCVRWAKEVPAWTLPSTSSRLRTSCRHHRRSCHTLSPAWITMRTMRWALGIYEHNISNALCRWYRGGTEGELAAVRNRPTRTRILTTLWMRRWTKCFLRFSSFWISEWQGEV